MFEKVDPKTLDFNVFSAIGDQWMLITAGTKDKCNTMTASWGGLGILWGAPMALAYIRPQRYTRQFVDDKESFTLLLPGLPQAAVPVRLEKRPGHRQGEGVRLHRGPGPGGSTLF